MLQLRQDRAPSILLQKNPKETTDKKHDEENLRTSSSNKSSRSNKSKINKFKKSMKRFFTTVEDKIEELEDKYSELTSSDNEYSDLDSRFQLYNNLVEPQKGFQIFQIDSNNRDQTP